MDQIVTFTGARDHILRLNILPILLRETDESEPIAIREQSLQLITSLISCKPPPPLEDISPTLAVLMDFAKFSKTKSMIDNACSALFYLLDASFLPESVQHQICTIAVGLLNCPWESVQHKALSLIQLVTFQTDIQTGIAFSCSALPALQLLLETASASQEILQQVCLNLGHILAGSERQIEAAINAGVIETLSAQLDNPDIMIRTGALWAISKATARGSSTQIQQLVDKGFVDKIWPKLASEKDTKILLLTLKCIKNIVMRGIDLKSSRADGRNPYVVHIEGLGGLKYLDKLLRHQQLQLRLKCCDLLPLFAKDH